MYNFRDRRALLLDPNEQNRMLLEYAMLMGRIDYETAETRQELFALWKPGEFAFALLNLDIAQTNVFEIATHLRHTDPDIAILIFSINDDPLSIFHAIKSGCDVYFGLPFQFDMVLTLMKVLDAENIRTLPRVLVVDDRSRPHWESRLQLA